MGRTQWLSGFRGRLFLSYSTDDRPVASRVAQALRNAGFAVFFDQNDLPPGGDFNERISRAIARSDAIICLISPGFIRAGAYTRSEVAAAELQWPSAVGRALPVMIEPVAFNQLPAWLASVTVLQPQGNPEADILTGVRRLRRWNQRWRIVAAGLVTAVLIAAAASWAGFTYFEAEARGRTMAGLEMEIETNARTLGHLTASTVTLAETALAVAEALRTPDIEILAGLFPQENVDNAHDPAALTNLFNERMDWLVESGLLENDVQLGRATEACAAIARTIERTRNTLTQLTDMNDPRTAISDTAWSGALDQAMRRSRQDALQVASLYADMKDARLSYQRVAASTSAYLDAVHAFCTVRPISRATLSTALAAERLAFQTLDLQLRRTIEINERAGSLLPQVRSAFSN